MDIYLTEDTCAGVGEFVRDAGGSDEDLPGGGLKGGVADRVGGLSFLDDKDFLIGMRMEFDVAARWRGDDDKGGVGDIKVDALKLPTDIAGSEVAGFEDAG